MRATSRLLASAVRYLEAGTPTGLTGLKTHASPRSALLYTYSSTLEKLKQFPETSVYRQATEALTKHRLNIIEGVKPEGLDAWLQRVKETVDTHPEAFRRVGTLADSKMANVVYKNHAVLGLHTDEYDDEPPMKAEPEGPRFLEERAHQREAFSRDIKLENAKVPRIEPEPPLSGEQINEIESQIGAGLIEEIIQVAEGESQLVDRMLESKIWEELEVKPTEGQWAYYERGTHVPQTQAR